MTTRSWRGDQLGLYQITTITVSGTWATSDTGVLTINGKSITVTVGGDTAVADIADILGRMVNGDAVKGTETRTETGDNIGEFADITATYSGAVLTLTADDVGIPFTITASETTAGDGAIGSPSTTTSPAGPSEMSQYNITGAGALSGVGNALVFEDSTVACLYGLDQSSTGTWDEVRWESTFTGDMGLNKTRSASPTDFAEYLDRYFKINATSVVIGEGSGSGSGRMHLDLSTTQTAVVVRGLSSSSDTGLHALRLKAVNAANTLVVTDGSVDIAPDAGDTSQFSAITASGSGTVRTSIGTTFATLTASGSSTVVIESDTGLTNITTINVQDDATVTIEGDNAIGTLNVYSGTVNYNGSGTITTVKVGSTATLDLSDSVQSCIWTNTQMDAGATIRDPSGLVTFSNAIDLGLAGLEDVTLELGKGINILPS